MGVCLDLKIDKIYYVLITGTMYNQLTPEGLKPIKVWNLHIYYSDKSRHREMIKLRKETEYRDFLVLDLTAKELMERAKLTSVAIKEPGVIKDLSQYKKIKEK